MNRALADDRLDLQVLPYRGRARLLGVQPIAPRPIVAAMGRRPGRVQPLLRHARAEPKRGLSRSPGVCADQSGSSEAHRTDKLSPERRAFALVEAGIVFGVTCLVQGVRSIEPQDNLR